MLFVGQMLVSDAALDYFRDNAEVLWQVPLAVALLAIYYAAIGVALASLTSRRIVAGVAILALALVPSVVTGAVLAANDDEHGAVAVLNLLALPIYLRDLIFLGHIDPDNILKAFTDLAVVAERCPRGCTHLPDAPDCAIVEAVEAGELGETGRARLDSLQRLLQTFA